MDRHPSSNRTLARRIGWALCVSLVACASLSLAPNNGPPAENGRKPPQSRSLHTFVPANAADLVRVLEDAWQTGASGGRVPNLAPLRLPPDLADLPVPERKNVFLRSVLPWVLHQNRRIAAQRKAVAALARRFRRGGGAAELDRVLIDRLSRDYRLEPLASDDSLEERTEELLRRVDVLPPSLVLAQAAVESAWGCSRFAREGNALFGQWVFSPGLGMAPLDRPEGRTYGVARFPDLGAAVASYLRNLNTSWAYEPLRELRRDMRDADETLRGPGLAPGLLLYSQRREAYIEELGTIIRQNRLQRFDDTDLGALDPARVRSIVAGGGLPGPLGSLQTREIPDA